MFCIIDSTKKPQFLPHGKKNCDFFRHPRCRGEYTNSYLYIGSPPLPRRKLRAPTAIVGAPPVISGHFYYTCSTAETQFSFFAGFPLTTPAGIAIMPVISQTKCSEGIMCFFPSYRELTVGASQSKGECAVSFRSRIPDTKESRSPRYHGWRFF